MASLTVSAPCKLSSVSSSLAGMKLASKPTVSQQHRVVMMPVKASSSNATSMEVEKEKEKEKEAAAMQRRSVMFAAAAAAVSAVSQGMNAMAAAEPRNGTPEAKKLYARICATMPTAKVCHY